MKYRLRTLRRARQDVEAIMNWIANKRKAPQGAVSWLQAYEKTAESLVNSPHSFGLAPENGHVEKEIRQFLFKTRRGRMYRGLFTIDGDEVLILRVRGPGQPVLQSDELQ